MRGYWLIAACLAVSLSAGAAMSADASASSSPALYECAKLKKNATTKKYEGRYEKGCSKENSKGEGEYEIKEGFGKGKLFKAKGGGANLEAPGVGGIDCLKSSAVGKFTSPTTGGNVVATFGDCEYDGHKCNSLGAATGTIVTDTLLGTDGYLEGKGTGSPKVGAVFSPETGEALAEFACGSTDFAVTGSVIGEITPVNKFSKEAIFSFRQKAIGVQEWETFEGGEIHELEVHLCPNCIDPATESLGIAGDEELEIKAKIEELNLKA